ncbi:hypothetical protein [Sorangium sp. So ce131]|uniref:hypothetical protein n=1 Tax=Sorangium sp. So ce131 TaxID=3133282 RepID=UPI003F625D0F
MNRVISIGVVRKRARKAVDTLRVANLDPDEFTRFSWAPGASEPLREISEDEFFQEDAPAGVYTFELLDEEGNAREKISGAKLELRAEDAEQRPHSLADVARSASILVNNAAAEAERAARRLKDEEERVDKLRELLGLKDDRIRELESENAEQARRIEELESDDDLGELGEVLREVLVQWLGEAPTDQHAQALEVVLEVIRRSADVQRALQLAGAGESLRLLGIGGPS